METINKILDQQNKLIPNVNLLESFEAPKYEEIELDFDETEEALRLGREKKYLRLKREEYNKKLSEQETFQKHTAEQLFKWFSEQFAIADEIHEKQIKQLCCYFANDSRFAGDLNKGILLLGNVGNGKTTLMKLFSVNQNHSFRVVSMLDISFDYKMDGEEGTKSYCVNFKTAPNIYGKREYGYCFDDLGIEEVPARHYAESKNIFAEILQVRYNNRNLVPFNSMHITTNQNEEELLKLYGSRTYDRMKEMFNVYVFNHTSFRGKI